MTSLDLPAQFSSVAAARSFVSGLAAGRVMDLDAVVLMTSELVTNVVRHTASEFTVRVDVGPPFRVEVQDGHVATDAFRALIAERPLHPPVTSVGGRGISVIHALATRVGLDDHAFGKVVWFEVETR